ncbi:MAG: ExeM/NucH family extracellular endonuclease [Pseudomonadota bacterium]
MLRTASLTALILFSAGLSAQEYRIPDRTLADVQRLPKGVAPLKQVIAFDLVNSGSMNLTSFTASPDNTATNGAFPSSALDVFGITDRTVNTDFADDSASSGDNLGLIGAGDTDTFFGVEDLDNSDNPGGTGTGVWTFDVSGFVDLELSIDVAAMGDFEAGDNSHTISYTMDGGSSINAFTLDGDNAGNFTYTLESGSMFNLNDPMTITEVGTGATTTVTNNFSSFSADLTGSGSELVVTLTSGVNNGGGEVIAFRDIVVSGSAGSSAPAELIAFEDFDGGDINLTSTTNVFDYGAGGGAAGDVFGRVEGGVTGMPFDVADDTVADVSGGGIDAGDTLGLAGQNTTAFFALNDADGASVPAGLNNAVWTFDISSAAEITDITIDLAALGDFEASSSDGFLIEAQIDGGGYQTLFRAATNESEFKTYRAFDGGGAFADDDPLELFIDGSATPIGFLDKSDPATGDLDAYASTLLAGQAGATLDIRVSYAGTPSGSEPMGIDNIAVNGIPPASPLISEFEPNPDGADPANVTVELSGQPGQAFSGFLVSIEADFDLPQTIDRVVAVSGTFDASGLLTASIPDLENPSFTFVLLDDGFTGMTGDAYTGPSDLTGTVLDAIGVPDSNADTARIQGTALGGTDLPFTGIEPELVFRGGSTGELFIVNDALAGTEVFDTALISYAVSDFTADPIGATFGTVNPSALPGAPLDAAPQVSSTTPSDLAFGVDPASDITIDFDEPVTIAANAVTIDCDVSGMQTAPAAGQTGVTSLVIDPSPEFAGLGDSCTVTVAAADVTDEDGSADPLDGNGDGTGGDDFVFTFDAFDNVCGAPATLISAVQGSGTASPIVGQIVTIEGVVVGDFQDRSSNGFFVQEESADEDGDPSTSEGLFIFEGGNSVDVDFEDIVRVTGEVVEFNDLTELTNVSLVQNCSSAPTAKGGGPIYTTALVTFPLANAPEIDLEAREGMRVTVQAASGDLTLTEVAELGRFGEVLLSSGGRVFQHTQLNTPNAGDFAAYQAEVARRTIKLNDGESGTNPVPLPLPPPALSAMNTLRGGETLTSFTAPLTFSFGDYKLEIDGTEPLTFNDANPRPAAPADVGGTLKIASFNVLNYFNGDGLGGGFPTPRGAETPAEFVRQSDKIVAALIAMDAAVVGLVEIENDAGANSALAELVAELNAVAGAGTYDFVDTGVIGGDQIKVALIYQPTRVAPAGTFNVLDTAAFVNGLEPTPKNRPALAQTFTENATGEAFTAIVNHFKSKGAPCNVTPGDNDTVSGQGNCNGTRAAAARELLDWIATDAYFADPDVIILGDLNAYAEEEPITTLELGGFVDLANTFVGAGGYSFVFGGQWGTLDYALASTTMLGQVTGATEWHINADEPVVFAYESEFPQSSVVKPADYYEPDAFRSADHDPIVVGLLLGGDAPTNIGVTIPSDLTEREGLTGQEIVLARDNNRRRITVDIAHLGGTAVADEDFVSVDGTQVTFERGGELVRRIPFATLDDDIIEDEETFEFGFSTDAAGVSFTRSSQVVTIIDDDTPAIGPTAVGDFLPTIDEDSSVQVEAAELLANDLPGTDTDGLTLTQVRSPQGGSVSLSDGVVTFVAAPDYFGSAGFEYGVRGDGGLTAFATVEFAVAPVNDAPSFTAGPDLGIGTGAELFQLVAGWASNISAGPNEGDQTLTFTATVVADPSGVLADAVSVAANGDLSYVISGAEGTAEIELVLSDNGGGANESVPQTFFITVADVTQVIVRRTDNGKWFTYLLDGDLLPGSGGRPFTRDPAWTTRAIRDLNGDDVRDLLVRNDVTGEWHVYYLDGSTGQPISERHLAISPDLEDEFEGVGDLNGDGIGDVLTRKPGTGAWIGWFLTAAGELAFSETLDIEATATTETQDIGDFDGNGTDELLLRDASDGRWTAVVFAAGSGTVAETRSLSLTRRSEWVFQGVGDFDGNGRDDVLVRRTDNGRWVIYHFDERGVRISQPRLRLTPRLVWALQWLDDFDGDGNTDVLVRRSDDGRWTLYRLDGDTILERGRLQLTPQEVWQAQER